MSIYIVTRTSSWIPFSKQLRYGVSSKYERFFFFFFFTYKNDFYVLFNFYDNSIDYNNVHNVIFRTFNSHRIELTKNLTDTNNVNVWKKITQICTFDTALDLSFDFDGSSVAIAVVVVSSGGVIVAVEPGFMYSRIVIE